MGTNGQGAKETTHTVEDPPAGLIVQLILLRLMRLALIT
jgi:hypothetical protein